jgi:N12 class adenine-specific DNA methylase
MSNPFAEFGPPASGVPGGNPFAEFGPALAAPTLAPGGSWFDRMRARMADDPEAGSVLPLAGDATKGTLRPAVPNILRSIGRGAIDLLEGPTTGTVTPEGTAALLLAGPLAGVRNVVPRGAPPPTGPLPPPAWPPTAPPPGAPPRVPPSTPPQPGIAIPEGLFGGGGGARPTLAPQIGPNAGGVAQPRPPGTQPAPAPAPQAVTTWISPLDAAIAATNPAAGVARPPTLGPPVALPPNLRPTLAPPIGPQAVQPPPIPVAPLGLPAPRPGETATPPTAAPEAPAAPPAALAPPANAGAAAPPPPAAPPAPIAPGAPVQAAAGAGDAPIAEALPTSPEIVETVQALGDALANPRTPAQIAKDRAAQAAAPPADPPAIPPPSPAGPPPLTPQAIADAAEQAGDPTPAQAAAGNYKLGEPTKIGGITVRVETPLGRTRSGVDPDGKPWSVDMPADYGKILGTKGADGDPVDVYLGPAAHEAPNHPVIVVDQIDPRTGRFDEHKVLIGYPSQDAALAAYSRAFNDGSGPDRIGAVTPLAWGAFRAFIRAGGTTNPLKYVSPADRAARDAEAAEIERKDVEADVRAWVKASGIPGFTDAMVREAVDIAYADDGRERMAVPEAVLEVISRHASENLDNGEQAAADANVPLPFTLEPTENGLLPVPTPPSGESPAANEPDARPVVEPPAASTPVGGAGGSPNAGVQQPAGAGAPDAGQPGGRRPGDGERGVREEPEGVAEFDLPPDLEKRIAAIRGKRAEINKRDFHKLSEENRRRARMYSDLLTEPENQNDVDRLLDAVRYAVSIGRPELGETIADLMEHYSKTTNQTGIDGTDAFLKAEAIRGRAQFKRLADEIRAIVGETPTATAEPEVAAPVAPQPAPEAVSAPEPAAEEEDTSRDDSVGGRSEADDAGAQPQAPAETAGDGEADGLPAEPVGPGGRPVQRDADDDGEGAPAGGADVRGSGEVESAGDVGGEPDGVRDADSAPGDPENAVAGPKNYVITDEDGIGKGGLMTKARNNLAAIRVMKQIEEEGRSATHDEQQVLVQYVGWGGIKGVFEPRPSAQWQPIASELRELLTDAEWKSAAGSTLNAHYTSPEVVKGVWAAVEHMGFKGGRVLEPSAGVGHFIGMAPQDLPNKLRWSAGELDDVTGRILRLIYPEAAVNIGGFEDARLPLSFYDLAISNVPFGEYGVHDPRPEYDHARRLIHDYFFARALDHVRPGGVVAFITSKGTLDKIDDRTRKMLAGKAAFLGAVRLPDTAFKSNANTEVTTDVVFLRRLMPDEQPDMEAPWLGLGEVTPRDGRPIPINQYFVDHPEMMLGTMQRTGTMYRAGEPTLEARPGQDIGAALLAAVQNLPRDGYRPPPPRSAPNAAAPLEPAAGEREGSFGTDAKGNVYQVVNGLRAPVAGKRGEIAKSYVTLRDAVRALAKVEQADAPDAEVAKARTALNKAYDAFTAKHGPLNQATKRRSSKGGVYRVTPILRDLKDDPDIYRVAALEDYDDATGKASKRAIFRERIIGKASRVETAASPYDAVSLSIDRFGYFDLPFAAQALGMTERDAITAFGDLIFRNPDGEQWETAVEYLSGDVRGKMKRAEAAAAIDPQYRRNVEALAPKIPADLIASPDPLLNEIAAPLGANWIPAEIYLKFLDHVAQRPVDPQRTTLRWSRRGAAWAVEFTANSRTHPGLRRFSTDQAEFLEVLSSTMNNQSITIYDKTKDDPPAKVVNKKETDKARAAQTALREEFANWIYTDPEQAADIAKLYNEKYNNLAPRDWHAFANALTLPGITKQVVRNGELMPFQLRPHQIGAVSRIVASGNTLLGHAVGAGKTFTMIAAGMEMKRLGMVRKPVYVVPNHMLGQFTREFYELYPNANVTIARKEDMSKAGRQAFVGRIAAENADAIIMTHSSFGRLPMRPGAYAEFIQEELDAVTAAIEELIAEEGKGGATVRLVQKRRKALEARLRKLQAEEKKDTGATFEETGIDFVFVDEAHEFKNLPIATKMGNVRGLSTSASGKAVDLLVKMRHLDKMNPGRAGVFATGTPVSNTMAEVYTMQRFLQPRMLEEQGIESFDGWASSFGTIVTSLEVKPSGEGFKEAKRFSRFVNAPELTAMFSTVSDVQTAEMLNLPRPTLKGGKPTIVELEATPVQAAIAKELTFRYENMPKDPREDNVLKVVSEGRKAALDPRLLDAGEDVDSGLKLKQAAKEITKRWKAGNDHPTAKLQIVFCDLGTPGGRARSAAAVDAPEADAVDGDPYSLPASDMPEEDDSAPAVDAEQRAAEAAEAEAAALSRDSGFNVYDDLAKRLVASGIPREQIAFIHDAKTDAQKEEMFAAARSGKIRVLIGSTAKMGVGTNVQALATAMHHLDAPWRPSDVEQRDGRILRQGNRNAEVEILRYVTKGTFDAYMWQTLEAKATFIGQFLAGSKGKRSVEDIDTPLPDAATMKAIATGDMRILERAELEREINTLRAVRENHARVRQQAEALVKRAPTDIASYENRIAEDKAVLARVKGAKWAGPGGKAFDGMKEAAQAAEQPWAAMVRKAIQKIEGREGEETTVLTLPLTFAGSPVKATIEVNRFTQMTWSGKAVSLASARLSEFRVEIDGQTWIANSLPVSSGLDFDTLAFQEGEPTFTPDAVMRRIASMFQSLPERIAGFEKRIADTKIDAAKAEETASKPFAREAEYQSKLARLAELDKAFADEATGTSATPEADEDPDADDAPQLAAGWDAVEADPEQAGPNPEAIEAIADAVRAMTGGRVTVRFVREAFGAGAVNPAAGRMSAGGLAYGPLIIAALDQRTPWNLHHETVHALRNLGVIEKGEWKVLEAAAARGGWLREFQILKRYAFLSAEKQMEEAVAEKFAQWSTGAETPKGRVARTWNRVRGFVDRLGNGLAGRGFINADDVFRRIKAGAMADRATGSRGRTRGPKTADEALAALSFFDTFKDTKANVADVMAEAMFALAPQGGGQTTITFQPAPPGRLDEQLYRYQDRHIDAKRTLEAIQETGGTITDANDVRLNEELFHARVAKATKDFRNEEVRPLLERMERLGVKMPELEEYLWARHAEERNAQIAKIDPNRPDGGSGMTDAEAQRILGQYQNGQGGVTAKGAALAAVASAVDLMAGQNRRTLLAYGLEDAATLQRWTDAYQHYVPLYREDMADPELLASMQTGAGFSVRGQSSRRAMGSDRPVVDILGNLFQQRERAIIRGEKNRVANALVDLARDNPNPGFWRVNQPPMQRVLDRSTGLVKMVADLDYKDHPNVVVARSIGQNGKLRERYVVFNERDPRALRMAIAMKNLDVDQLHHLLGRVAIATRLIARLNTQYNPIFGIVNLLRDTLEGAINLTSTAIPLKQGAVMRNTPLALAAIMRSLRRERRQAAQRTDRWTQAWEEFQTVGGPTGYRDMFVTSADRAREIERELKRMGETATMRAVKAPLRWVRDALSDFNDAMENAVRLSVFVAAKDAGQTPMRAASIAKNITVNFNRKGAWTNEISSLFAFFNASVQGTTRMLQTLAAPAGKAIIAGGLALGMVQQLTLHAAGFEENEIPAFVLENNLIIPTGGKDYAKVPLPLGFKMLPNIGRVSTELYLSGGEDAGKKLVDLVGTVAGSFNPFGSAGLSYQSIAPTVSDPIAAVAENRDWTGRDIALLNRSGLDPSPGYTRARDTATSASRAAAYAINSIGGTDWTPGYVSPTPDQIDYLVGQYAGGLGREVMNGLRSLDTVRAGGAPDVARVPLLGRFVGSANAASATRSVFYENMKKLNAHERIIKGMAGAGQDVPAYLAKNPEARMALKPGPRVSAPHDAVLRQIGKMRQEQRAMKAAGADKEAIARLDKAITDLMARFNAQVQAAKAR